MSVKILDFSYHHLFSMIKHHMVRRKMRIKSNSLALQQVNLLGSPLYLKRRLKNEDRPFLYLQYEPKNMG